MLRIIGYGLLLLGFLVQPLKPTQALPPITSDASVSATVSGGATGGLRLTGYASPNALVTFLKNGTVMGTTITDSAGLFDRTFNGLNPGVQTFGVFATDSLGRNTITLSIDVNIMSGSTVTVSGFLLPSTFSVSKVELKRPEIQVVNGIARQNATITAFFDNGTQLTKRASTDTIGIWQVSVPETLHIGNYLANALVQDQSGNQSVLSQTIQFKVVPSADLNVDNLINLFDFSILMFNYGQSNPPNKAADINDNGLVDLVDFSIMMFNWTGG